jgi:CDP-2,3-bis-(O-geranylgeranyl)-sn-glycerol synthase
MIELLLLILVANGTPVVISYLFRDCCAWPVDLGYRLSDKQFCFGPHKTWRGVFFSLLLTGLVSILAGYDFWTGVIIAVLSMAGDLLTSFLKRRLGKESGSRLIMLDQFLESCLPAYWFMAEFQLDYLKLSILVLCFIIIDQLLSVIFYKLGVRKHPY